MISGILFLLAYAGFAVGIVWVKFWFLKSIFKPVPVEDDESED